MLGAWQCQNVSCPAVEETIEADVDDEPTCPRCERQLVLLDDDD